MAGEMHERRKYEFREENERVLFGEGNGRKPELHGNRLWLKKLKFVWFLEFRRKKTQCSN
jgi:hypothetical protein